MKKKESTRVSQGKLDGRELIVEGGMAQGHRQDMGNTSDSAHATHTEVSRLAIKEAHAAGRTPQVATEAFLL